MFVHLQQSRVFLQKLFAVPDDVVPLDAEAERKTFAHFFLPELLAYFPEVFVGLTVFVMLEVDGNSLLILSNVGVKPSQIDPALHLLFNQIQDLCCFFHSFLVGLVNDLKAFLDFFGVHGTLCHL